MVKYTVTVKPTTRLKLGIIRSNFMELAFERFLYVKDNLRRDTTISPIRLLCLKEIFSIFDEINRIEDVRLSFSDPKALDPLFELVTFVRNVLLHFPLFDKWEQIFISSEIASEMMSNRKGGQIAKYLDNNLNKIDIPFSADYAGGEIEAQINLSAIKISPQLTYLKDIISEQDVISILIDILEHLFTGKADIIDK